MVYTYDSFSSEYGAGPEIKKGFEFFCQCTLQFVSFGDANFIFNRLLLEGNKTKADIALGLDNTLYKKAEQAAIFQNHGLDWPKGYAPIVQGEKSTLLLPFDYGWLGLLYHTNHFKKPYSSLEELLQAKSQSPFLILQDPRSSSPGLGFLVWLQQIYPQTAPKILKEIAQKTQLVSPGWSESYQVFLAQEASIVLSYVTSPLYHELMENRTDIQALDLKEGAFLQVEYAGISKFSQNLQLAKNFLAWFLSPNTQKILPKTQWMFPVAPVVLEKPFQKVQKKFSNQTQLIFPSPEERKKWIEEWLSNQEK